MVQNSSRIVKRTSLLLSVAASALVLSQSISGIAIAQSATMPFPIPASVGDGTTVRIDGADSMMEINQALRQQFEQEFPGTDVQVDAQGTDAAIVELLNDQIDLAAIARPLTDEEKAKGLVEVPISQDKIAVIVGKNNPFNGSLTVEQFVKIIRGEITDWSEVGGKAGAIRLIDRPELSDTRVALSRYGFFQDGHVTGANAVQLGQDSTAEVIRQLGRNGISYAIAGQLATQTLARPVKIVVPYETLPDDALYPYVQPRGYAYKRTPGIAAQSFLGFAGAEPAQTAIATAKTAEAAAVVKAFQPKPVMPDETTSPGNRRILLWLFLPLILLGLLLQSLIKFFQSLAARSKAPVSEDSIPTVQPQLPPTHTLTAELVSPTADEEPPSPAAPVIQEAAIEEPATPASVIQESTVEEPATPVASIIQEAAVVVGLGATIIPAIEDAIPVGIVSRIADTTVNLDDLFAEGRKLAEAGRYDEALPYLSQVVEAKPDFAAAWNLQGSILAKLGRSEAAIASFNRALDLDSTLITAWSGKGDMLLRLGRSAEAKASFDQAVVLQRATTTAQSLAGVATENLIAAPIPEAIEASNPETAVVPAEQVLPATPSLETVAENAALSSEEMSTSDFTISGFKQAFHDHLFQLRGITLAEANSLDCYLALAYTLRDRLLLRSTPETYLTSSTARLVTEFSAEYMPGVQLENTVLNLDIAADVHQALQELGLDFQTLVQQEEEPGLGRGGLGRLMVCYLDSMATAEIPAIGYGIRYEYGIFDQTLEDGWQVEVPDTWLHNGNPWEIERPEAVVTVQFGGRTEAYVDAENRFRVRWVDAEDIQGIPYDTLVPGYKSNTVNLLRLWKAETEENLSKVLYPADMEHYGKQLRLKQQHFFTSCAVQDILRMHLKAGGTLETLPERFALQLNDTDCILAIAELMRLLMDSHGMAWDAAWQITCKAFSYTNHSLLPEALDSHHYTLNLVQQFLPRHCEIILEINCQFLNSVREQHPGDEEKVAYLSLIEETGDKFIRMVNLALVGSHAVNGVSLGHTELLKQKFSAFYAFFPSKFSSKTNGITPRRFLALTNPTLATLITSKVGDRWLTQLEDLKRLESLIYDTDFCRAWQQIKQWHKQHLAAYIHEQTGISIDPASLFDIHVTEIHEHKRQHLNLLQVIARYNRIKENPAAAIAPRTVIFSGKAAPDYATAKLMIKLINAVASAINPDPDLQGRLKLVFLPDFTLKLHQLLLPATDLAEFIATAGTEASATGNMMAALNGGLTIGTPDGSNLELRDAVGTENFFQFGLSVDPVMERSGSQSWELYNNTPALKQAIDQISSGVFSQGDTELFKPLVDLLLYSDQYQVLADYSAYVECQEQVDHAYGDAARWTRMSILNVARIGRFSSDRAIREYCRDIWNIEPGKIDQRSMVQA